MSAPDVDLVIAFRATRTTSLSKQQTREDARKAEKQYARLIETLTYAGIKAVGRRGESLGHLLVFVTCPPKLVDNLIKRERHSDFLSGLPVTPVASDAHLQPLSPADRIRLVHAFISSTPADGGLGISSDSPEWDLIESIFPLQNREFNELWVKAWKPRNIASVQLEKIREQFGDALALYFAFLSSYTTFLVTPALLGLLAHFVLLPYSPIYSILLAVWSLFYVEWWRVHERILSLRFGTRGSFRVEKRRAQYKIGMPWWKRDLRVLASIPVILVFAAALSGILTGIFVFEAFITQLYQGPGRQIVAFSPTLLFVVLVPRFLAVYHALAVRLTNWENHAHQSTYAFSLTLKTFALGALVAYTGLGLSAFVYVPFGEGVMHGVQRWLFSGTQSTSGFSAKLRDMLNGTAAAVGVDATIVTSGLGHKEHAPGPKGGLWDMDAMNARRKLNPARLRDQMFAYTVTNQAVNTFVEVGLPFVLRGVEKSRKGKGAAGAGGANHGVEPKKRVVFEDEKERGGLEERAFLDRVRAEAALPEYDLFADYSEMVVQFGYVVLWSTIWPLAGVMALLNNILELRSDAFKIAVHHRRPIPTRTDTIGPWLDALTFLTWLGALTNSALIYLFSPSLLSIPTAAQINATTILSPSSLNNTLLAAEEHLVAAAGGLDEKKVWGVDGSSTSTFGETKELLMKAALVALIASHGYLLARALVRHLVERVWWRGSEEVVEREKEEREVKERFLSGVGVQKGFALGEGGEGEHVKGHGVDKVDDPMGFWDHDEGLEEIQRIVKEA